MPKNSFFTSRFPVGRIKRIMQMDEEVSFFHAFHGMQL
jgi:hypothetical protein